MIAPAPRLNLRTRLRGAISALLLGPPRTLGTTSSRMPDIEAWPTPHRVVDMQDWETAVNMARNVFLPDRWMLMDVYDSILVDTHVRSCIESRVLRAQHNRFKLMKGEEQQHDLCALFETVWFADFVRYAVESQFRGHTLIELSDVAPGQVKCVNRIDQRFVLPYEGVVIKRRGDRDGYKYREEPLATYEIELGRADDLGLLADVAPMVIFKKYGMASWSDYIENFGVPPRWVKSSSTDKARHVQLGEVMKQMLSSTYAVINDDEDIKVMDTPGTDAFRVFDQMVVRCNSEISKRILGQDGTSDNKDASGTYGSLQVLQGVAEDRHKADKMFLHAVINEQLFPRLIKLGYPLQGVRFCWDELRDLETMDLVKAVQMLNVGFEIDPDEIAKRTGIPIIGLRRMPGELNSDGLNGGNGNGNEPRATPPGGKGAGRQSGKQGGGQSGTGEPPIEDDGEEEDGATASWPSLRTPVCSHCGGITSEPVAFSPIVQAAVDQLLADAHAGREWSQPYFEAVAKTLQDGLSAGWGHDLDQLSYDTPDHVARTSMEANLFRFSAAKTLAAALDLNAMARDSKGFADFKAQVEKSGLIENYDRRYLETEYVNAVNTGMQSSRWYQMQASADALPYGEYWTQQDDRVREAHRALDGLILPLSDPKWSTIWPPNGWKCRCTVLPVSHAPSEAEMTRAGQEAMTALDVTGELARMKQGGFDKNRAVTGEVFALNKSYREQLGDKAGKPVKLNVEQSYGAQSADYTLDAINARALPPAPPGAHSAEEALRGFNANADGVQVLKDYAGRQWAMTKSMVEEHLGGQYAADERYKTLHLVPDVLRQPDEVWLTSPGGTNTRLAFVRYYDGQPVVVRAEADMRQKDQPMRIGSWYTLDAAKEGDVRNGILVKSMLGR